MAALVLSLWALSHGQPRGVSYFLASGGFYNVTLSEGAAWFQTGTFPRVSPSFAADADGSLGWHAVAPDPGFPERPTHSFFGVVSGNYTAPLRRHANDKTGVHWSEVRFVSWPFRLVAALLAVVVVVVGYVLWPGRREAPMP